MRIHSYKASLPLGELASSRARKTPEPGFKPTPNDNYERRSAYLAMAGLAVIGAGAGFAAGASPNPWIGGALGSFAGASAGLTAAAFTPKTPFLALAGAGAAAGAALGSQVQHPAATAALTLAGATLPLGLIFGLADGFE